MQNSLSPQGRSSAEQTAFGLSLQAPCVTSTCKHEDGQAEPAGVGVWLLSLKDESGHLVLRGGVTSQASLSSLVCSTWGLKKLSAGPSLSARQTCLTLLAQAQLWKVPSREGFCRSECLPSHPVLSYSPGLQLAGHPRAGHEPRFSAFLSSSTVLGEQACVLLLKMPRMSGFQLD